PAGIVALCLAICDVLIRFGDRVAGAYWYVPAPPDWWLWVFYLGVLGFIFLDRWQLHVGWFSSAALAWACLGLVFVLIRWPVDELRCTFLAVGHGGCTVLETADGRTILYDAGSLAGPEVGRRQIAPFLWHRGIRHIDEIVLSHADLDHFNG